jgi:hypothetical protein
VSLSSYLIQDREWVYAAKRGINSYIAKKIVVFSIMNIRYGFVVMSVGRGERGGGGSYYVTG